MSKSMGSLLSRYCLPMGVTGASESQVAEVWRILDEGRSSLALVIGDSGDVLATNLARFRSLAVTRVSALLTAEGTDAWRDPERALRDHRVLADIDIIFSPEILIEPMRLLTRLARRHSVVAVWPGEISDGVASYSCPGRRDYLEVQVPDDALVFRTRATTFPDQATFEVESVR